MYKLAATANGVHISLHPGLCISTCPTATRRMVTICRVTGIWSSPIAVRELSMAISSRPMRYLRRGALLVANRRKGKEDARDDARFCDQSRTPTPLAPGPPKRTTSRDGEGACSRRNPAIKPLQKSAVSRRAAHRSDCKRKRRPRAPQKALHDPSLTSRYGTKSPARANLASIDGERLRVWSTTQ